MIVVIELDYIRSVHCCSSIHFRANSLVEFGTTKVRVSNRHNPIVVRDHTNLWFWAVSNSFIKASGEEGLLSVKDAIHLFVMFLFLNLKYKILYYILGFSILISVHIYNRR